MPVITQNGVTIVTDDTGKFVSATTINPVIDAVNTVAASAAHEINPATMHQAMNQLGAQIPPVPFLLGQSIAAAANPDAVGHLIESVASGNPLAILGAIFGIGINSYVLFNQTQLKGITNAQIEQSTSALTDAQLDSSVAAANASLRADTGNPASDAKSNSVQQTGSNGPG